MTADDTAPEGPDLAQGIPVRDLVEGARVQGMVDGEAVLLVRHDGKAFAVGAHCTHYGAPLADGIVTDGELRCPWHHACFSLETGQATAPPALNPLALWQVEEDGDTVRVGAKQPEADPLEPRAGWHHDDGSDTRAVVIIGGGAAGTAVAETLRAEGFQGTITIADGDADAPYDRPNLSKDYLAGTAEPSWLSLREEGFHAKHGIQRVQERAVAVDAWHHVITFASGNTLPYDALVLTTGSTPIRPSIPGADLAHVHVLRTKQDCDALIGATARARHVLIAGASFIGMEAAASLRARNLEVTVVAPEMLPFERVLGPSIGKGLMEEHVAHGVRFMLGRKLAAIEADRVVLDDGTTIDADVVLLGIGVTPDTALAEAAGLATDKGVLVNELMETSVANIYAAGDIARFPDPVTGKPIRIEHWVVAQRQGQTVARSIMGRRHAFTQPPFFWTRQYDTTVCYVGHAEQYTSIREEGIGADYAASLLDGERLVAYITVGRDRESLRMERAMEQAAVPAAVS